MSVSSAAAASTLRRPPKNLRVASLLPSATDICVFLGLADNVSGITHECDLQSVLDARRRQQSSSSSGNDNDDGDGDASSSVPVRILTGTRIDIHAVGQGEIDAAVKEAARKAKAAAVCPIGGGSGDSGGGIIKVESLYPILQDELLAARPTVVLTQNLCGVCAPSTDEVATALGEKRGGGGGTKKEEGSGVRIVSLEPESLRDVAESFVTVADACGVPERGVALRDSFLADLDRLGRTVDEARANVTADGCNKKPRVLLLEWLDPPYDGGHWIPEMIERAGCESAVVSKSSVEGFPTSWDSAKSKQITWADVRESDPDVVLVACCGFDLKRNIKDARGAAAELARLRAAQEGRVYAADGDLYFARPGPKLAPGANVVAQCAFDGMEGVAGAVKALENAPEEGAAWAKVDIMAALSESKEATEKGGERGTASSIHDIEDLGSAAPSKGEEKHGDFAGAHDAALAAGSMSYADPDTGYHVFTELAHKKRGKCCGSGCRHCPYDHENVKDEQKAGRINQPAFLCEGAPGGLLTPSPVASGDGKDSGDVKVLFFSGGKDSYLALRSVVRQRQSQQQAAAVGTTTARRPFSLVLLTTFDATSRIIAHQEIPIDTVLRQARHLGLALVGVPIHRGSSERYPARIRRALDVVRRKFDVPPSSDGDRRARMTLVFGDLHLAHIREWRDGELSKLGCDLEYPLWKRPYEELMDDLEASGVRCAVSASEGGEGVVKEGREFGRELRREAEGAGLDGFGEEGEFHTVAEVWGVSRERALGLVTE